MRALHLALMLGVILGIVAPKSSAALAELGLINAEVVVICTGQGWETITIGADGTPVHMDDSPDHCAQVKALATAPTPAPVPRPLRPLRMDAPAPVLARLGAFPFSSRFARAPPAA
ncbi:MAG: hypothetical protein ACK5IB_00340 [Qingshengfaniella sp.]